MAAPDVRRFHHLFICKEVTEQTDARSENGRIDTISSIGKINGASTKSDRQVLQDGETTIPSYANLVVVQERQQAERKRHTCGRRRLIKVERVPLGWIPGQYAKVVRREIFRHEGPMMSSIMLRTGQSAKLQCLRPLSGSSSES